MTRTVILIRHAKSDWHGGASDDHARPLNDRGRRAARSMGDWLRDNGIRCDLVLCSDALRTRQTAEGLFAGHTAPDIRLMPSLYHAAPDTIIELIAQQSAGCIAVIGHNPGIGMAADALLATLPDHPRFADYPTCAITVADFDGAIEKGAGQCRAFVIPADLD